MPHRFTARPAIAATSVVAAVDAVLLVAAAAGHPGALSHLDVLANLALIGLGLAVYAGASQSLLSRPGAAARLSLGAGGLIAAVFGVQLATEYFASLPAAAGALVTAGLIAAVLAVAARAGFVAVQRGAPLGDGVGCAVAAMLLGIAGLLGLNFAAGLGLPGRTSAILKPEYLSALPRPDRAFGATLEAALTHLIEAPILALAAGFAAALLARASARRRRLEARRALRART